jgi:capsular polysaccharide biosynthesis protein
MDQSMSDVMLGQTFRQFSAHCFRVPAEYAPAPRNLVFHDVTLDTISNIVFRSREPIHCSGYRTQREVEAALRRLDEAADEQFHGQTVFMAIHKFKNYYHWMAEIVPAIAGYQVYPGFADGILLLTSPQSIDDVMCQSIELATSGLPRARVHAAEPRPLALRHLVYSSLIQPLPGWSRFAGFVYDKMVKQVCPNRPKPFRKIFITRANAVRSPLGNEAELINLLARYDIEAIDPSTMTLVQQISIFQETLLVVGAHGAGLTNVVFLQPGAILYEIFPSIAIENVCYNILAQGRGVHYWADVFACAAPNLPGLAGLSQARWFVDLAIVAKRLEEIHSRLSRVNL